VPQDGRFPREVQGGAILNLRVSIMPASHGEGRCVTACLDKETLFGEIPELEAWTLLGFSTEEVKRFPPVQSARPYGMVLGDRGRRVSGEKRPRCMAAINEIKSDEDKIVTIEDPRRIPASRH